MRDHPICSNFSVPVNKEQTAHASDLCCVTWDGLQNPKRHRNRCQSTGRWLRLDEGRGLSKLHQPVIKSRVMVFKFVQPASAIAKSSSCRSKLSADSTPA